MSAAGGRPKAPSDTTVRVTVVTYRRAHLLGRALASLQRQTHTDWVAEVVNDDPDDQQPGRIVGELNDPRIRMFEPVRHRGGAVNINLAFRPGTCPLASLLEDDNWWEPEFLATMVRVLASQPDVALITANERVWREAPDGSWHETGETLRPDRDSVWTQKLRPIDKCGDAVLCNSAMVVRPHALPEWQLPAGLALDVSEHYLERLVPHPFLVHDRALVNFARTQQTFRSKRPFDWTKHQMLLVGSVLATLPATRREELADRLWARARSARPDQRVTLLLAGTFLPPAACLMRRATPADRARLTAHLVRRVSDLARYRRLLTDSASEWAFLQTSWAARAFAHMP